MVRNFLLYSMVISMLIFITFTGCSTIPMGENEHYEGEVEVEYHLSGEGTTSDELGIIFSWDAQVNAERYRVVLLDNGATVFDTVFAAFEIDQGDTVYNNSWTHEAVVQLGVYHIYFSNDGSGSNWTEMDSIISKTKSGTASLVSYSSNGSFAMYWDTANFYTIGREDSGLLNICEVFLFDPCDSAYFVDTTQIIVDTVVVIDTIIDTTVVPHDTFIDTTDTYDSTFTEDSVITFIELKSSVQPPFNGFHQAGMLNAGSDTSFNDLTIAPYGADMGVTTRIKDNQVIWLQSFAGRYLKIGIDSMYISPVTSDLDTAIIYFKWQYQLVPKLRVVY